MFLFYLFIFFFAPVAPGSQTDRAGDGDWNQGADPSLDLAERQGRKDPLALIWQGASSLPYLLSNPIAVEEFREKKSIIKVVQVIIENT